MVPGEAFGTPGYFRLSYALERRRPGHRGRPGWREFLADRAGLTTQCVQAARINSVTRAGGRVVSGGLADGRPGPAEDGLAVELRGDVDPGGAGVRRPARTTTAGELDGRRPSSSSGTYDRAGEAGAELAHRARVADPVGDDPAGQRHVQHAVREDAGQADRGGRRLTPVDLVEVAGRTGVADQLGAVDRTGQRRQHVADGDSSNAGTSVIRPAPGRPGCRRRCTTGSPAGSATSVRSPRNSLPWHASGRCRRTRCRTARRPATIGRCRTKRWSPCTTRE